MDNSGVKQLESGGILPLMLRYCVPTMAATTVQAAYNIVDRIFVGRFCGEDALAAITVCFSPALLLLSLAMMIGQGSAAILSIKLGEKDNRAAERVLGQSAFMFAVFYAAVLCAFLPFTAEILAFFGATEKIIDSAVAYYKIIIAGLVFEKVSFGINNLIRAEGRPAYAMSTMLVGAFSNIVLDYLLICVFDMGVAGAAYATVAAQAAGSLWVLAFYLSGRSCLAPKLSDFKVHKDLVGSVFASGSPSLIMQLLAGLGVSLYVKQACAYGDESTIAIVGVDFAATMFMFLPVVGFSMGMQPIFGYSYGAKNSQRLMGAFGYSLLFSTLFCTAAFAVAETFPEIVFRIFFGEDSRLLNDGARVLRILVACTPLIGVNIITSGFFQSTKRPAYSVVVTVIRQALFLIPLMYLLPLKFGLDGLWASFPLADFAAFLATLVFIWLKILPDSSKKTPLQTR